MAGMSFDERPENPWLSLSMQGLLGVVAASMVATRGPSTALRPPSRARSGEWRRERLVAAAVKNMDRWRIGRLRVGDELGSMGRVTNAPSGSGRGTGMGPEFVE